jgi:DUF4097 and DUF4098 domain-containing protein YvlB
MKKYAVGAAAILLAVAPAWAQRKVDEVRPLDPDGTVSISNLAGSVKVIGWSDARVEITGVLGRNVEDLIIEGDSRELEVEVDVPRHADDLETDLVLRVPANATVEIESVSATVEVEGLTGSVDVESVSGWVRTSGQPAEMSIETVSGDIIVAEAAPRTDLSSVSGGIRVQMATGRLDAETVSGSIRVENGSLQSGSFETVSGNIGYAGDMVGRGEYDFESMSGTISLELPSSVSADFDVSTFSGAIDNDIGPRARRTNQYTPEKELSFTTGSGGAEVSISSFSGNVKITTR